MHHIQQCLGGTGWKCHPMRRGCLGTSELSATGTTNLMGSRYMTMCSGEREEVQWEKKASGCKTRKYLKFPCSTGASQGLLCRCGTGYLRPTLTSAANPPSSHRNLLQNTPLLPDVASKQSPVSRRKWVAEENSLRNDGKEWDKTESG